MSEFFVRTFNKRNPCAHCRRAKLRRGGRVFSLCAAHLEEARKRWETWAADRRSEGKCCYCHRASYNGWLRCRFHTRINRENCRRWMLAHPGRDTWSRQLAWLAQRKCPSCKEHRALTGGFNRCAPCRRRCRAVSADRFSVVVNGTPVHGRGLS